MFALLVLALVASASAIAINKCPEVKPVENFDLASYAQGKWYEIGSYPSYENVYKCSVSEYKLEGDIFKVNSSGVHNKKKIVVEGSVRLAENAGNSGIITFSLPDGEFSKMYEYNFNVLSIDYDNYFIGYYCNYDDQMKSYDNFSWILSRSKIVSSDVKSKIDNFIKESKFLDSSKYIWADFSDEVCFVEA